MITAVVTFKLPPEMTREKLALFRRVVGSVKGRSRKTKAHLLPVRKSDVGGTWLVDDTGLGFLLDVREGAGRGVPLGGFSLGGPPVGATKVPPSRPPVPCARAVLALPAKSTAGNEHCRQDRRQFHDCARLYYSLVPLIWPDSQRQSVSRPHEASEIEGAAIARALVS